MINKSSASYFNPNKLFSDMNKFTLNPSHHAHGKEVLVGNKKLILRDMLNTKLNKDHEKSLAKTGHPFNSAKQTFFIDEQIKDYDHKTMAKGTYM
jgi:hypothetical protein